jgi:hypothetical protein
VLPPLPRPHGLLSLAAAQGHPGQRLHGGGGEPKLHDLPDLPDIRSAMLLTAWASSQSQRAVGVGLEIEELLGPGPWPEYIELGRPLHAEILLVAQPATMTSGPPNRRRMQAASVVTPGWFFNSRSRVFLGRWPHLWNDCRYWGGGEGGASLVAAGQRSPIDMTRRRSAAPWGTGMDDMLFRVLSPSAATFSAAALEPRNALPQAEDLEHSIPLAVGPSLACTGTLEVGPIEASTVPKQEGGAMASDHVADDGGVAHSPSHEGLLKKRLPLLLT